MTLFNLIGDWFYAVWVTFFPTKDDDQPPASPSA